MRRLRKPLIQAIVDSFFNSSKVDLECVDSEMFPNFEKLDNYWECVLKEGEMLFIPKKYWHFVKSLATSFSISFWWK